MQGQGKANVKDSHRVFCMDPHQSPFNSISIGSADFAQLAQAVHADQPAGAPVLSDARLRRQNPHRDDAD